jgi:hypothetical protein
VLLVFDAPCQLRLLAGPEHGRTIPLADIGELKSRRAVPRRYVTLIGTCRDSGVAEPTNKVQILKVKPVVPE